MRKLTKIALAVGAALTLGLAAAELTAHPSDMGWGGYGPGSGMHGYGMGHGMGPGAGMGYGMHGYGAFPEQAIGGYPPEDLVEWRSFLDGQRRGLARFAAETAASAPEEVNRNSALEVPLSTTKSRLSPSA